jgi:hypothetical protein
MNVSAFGMMKQLHAIVLRASSKQHLHKLPLAVQEDITCAPIRAREHTPSIAHTSRRLRNAIETASLMILKVGQVGRHARSLVARTRAIPTATPNALRLVTTPHGRLEQESVQSRLKLDAMSGVTRVINAPDRVFGMELMRVTTLSEILTTPVTM